MQLHEIKLCEPVQLYLESKGYKVYFEVPFSCRVVDIVAIKESSIIAIELKVGYCKKVLFQASRNLIFANQSYIAVGRSPRLKSVLTCKQNDVGVMVIGDSVELLNVPQIQDGRSYYREKIIESCGRNSENLIAGIPCVAGIGPAIQVNNAVDEYQKLNPSSTWKQIFMDVPNHYASPASMRQSLEKHRFFKKLKEKVKDNTCGQCRFQKYSCPKGHNRMDTSKACINFVRTSPKRIFEKP
ncbi:MAG: hypothetical protein PHD43_23115 [Methylococcales bacterium]|nr:hypothetical protein [Methylococcales bacterium]